MSPEGRSWNNRLWKPRSCTFEAKAFRSVSKVQVDSGSACFAEFPGPCRETATLPKSTPEPASYWFCRILSMVSTPRRK